jgi:hypothetical protein
VIRNVIGNDTDFCESGKELGEEFGEELGEK